MNTAKIYCLPCQSHKKIEIAGFYTLSATNLPRNNKSTPKALRKNGSPKEIPVILLGQFAIATKYEKNGYGTALLQHALKTFIHLSEKIGVVALIVDADGESAQTWWRKKGFTNFPPPDDNRLYLTLKDLKASMTITT